MRSLTVLVAVALTTVTPSPLTAIDWCPGEAFQGLEESAFRAWGAFDAAAGWTQDRVTPPTSRQRSDLWSRVDSYPATAKTLDQMMVYVEKVDSRYYFHSNISSGPASGSMWKLLSTKTDWLLVVAKLAGLAPRDTASWEELSWITRLRASHLTKKVRLLVDQKSLGDEWLVELIQGAPNIDIVGHHRTIRSFEDWKSSRGRITFLRHEGKKPQLDSDDPCSDADLTLPRFCGHLQ